jgi:hypothetical protein
MAPEATLPRVGFIKEIDVGFARPPFSESECWSEESDVGREIVDDEHSGIVGH